MTAIGRDRESGTELVSGRSRCKLTSRMAALRGCSERVVPAKSRRPGIEDVRLLQT